MTTLAFLAQFTAHLPSQSTQNSNNTESTLYMELIQNTALSCLLDGLDRREWMTGEDAGEDTAQGL